MNVIVCYIGIVFYFYRIGWWGKVVCMDMVIIDDFNWFRVLVCFIRGFDISNFILEYILKGREKCHVWCVVVNFQVFEEKVWGCIDENISYLISAINFVNFFIFRSWGIVINNYGVVLVSI